MNFSDSSAERSVLYGPFTRGAIPARMQRAAVTGDPQQDIATLATGDMTGDGKDDIAVFYFTADGMGKGGRFFVGAAGGVRAEFGFLPSAAAATVGDFNRDDKGDLATRTVPNGSIKDMSSDAGAVKIYYGASDGPRTSGTRRSRRTRLVCRAPVRKATSLGPSWTRVM